MIGCILIALSIIGSAIYVVEKLKPEGGMNEDHTNYHDMYVLPKDQLTDDRPEDEDARPEDYGSDELKKFIDAFDNRIESLKEELGSEYQQIQQIKNVKAGIVFDEDHSLVDSKYIRIPDEEYTK